MIELLLLFEFFSLFNSMIFLFSSQGKIGRVYDFGLIIILLLLGGSHHMADFCKLTHIILDLINKLRSHRRASLPDRTSKNTRWAQSKAYFWTNTKKERSKDYANARSNNPKNSTAPAYNPYQYSHITSTFLYFRSNIDYLGIWTRIYLLI